MEWIITMIQEQYFYFYGEISKFLGETYLNLLIFTVGLFVYAVFVLHFYKTLSKRDLFKLDLSKYTLPRIKHKTLGQIWEFLKYILKYGIFFPIYISVWFLMLSLFLLLLSKDITTTHILMTSIVVVSATRLASYYNEELSVDLAKLIPLALLAILITSPGFFLMETTIERLSVIPTIIPEIVQFITFSVLLEWALRFLYLIRRGLSKMKRKT